MLYSVRGINWWKRCQQKWRHWKTGIDNETELELKIQSFSSKGQNFPKIAASCSHFFNVVRAKSTKLIFPTFFFFSLLSTRLTAKSIHNILCENLFSHFSPEAAGKLTNLIYYRRPAAIFARSMDQNKPTFPINCKATRQHTSLNKYFPFSFHSPFFFLISE